MWNFIYNLADVIFRVSIKILAMHIYDINEALPHFNGTMKSADTVFITKFSMLLP